MFDAYYECAVFGHSHAGRLATAYQEARAGRPDAPEFPDYRFGLLRNLPGSGPQAARQAARRAIGEVLAAANPRLIVTILFGNTHNLWALPRHPRGFDFFLPGTPVAEQLPGTEVIPYRLLKQALAATVTRQSMPLLNDMRKLCPAVPLFLLPPPPPVASEQFLLDNAKTFGARFAECGISPVELRRKMWLLYRDVLGDLAAAVQATLVPLPDAVFDGGGCLAPHYWSDVTHGNDSYNALMIETIDELARSLAA